MPQTAVLLLPFPADTDPADVPTDMQELANQIEAVRGTPNGLAATDAAGKLPTAQLPLMLVPMLAGPPFPAPADGVEFVLTDSLTAPTYRWRLRHNVQGTPSQKRWEYVGGTAAEARVATSETTSTIGSYVNLATVGPRFTVPWAGDYAVRFGATFLDSAAESQCNIGVGTGDFSSPSGEARGHISAANYHLSVVGEAVLVGLAAGAEIRAKYQHAIAGTLTVLNRYLYVTPVRVG